MISNPILVAFFLVFTLFAPARAEAQGAPDLKTVLSLLNVASPGEPRYYEGDILDQDMHAMDLNGDGSQEYVAVPNSGCGETKNCSYYILVKLPKDWRVVLRGEGKVTGLTPYGFIVSPRKTNGFSDIVSVYDMGPEADGTRSLEQRIYTFNGIQYERFTEAYDFPETKALMQKVNQLKYQRRGK